MSVLHAGQKDNLIYIAARCFGEQRHGDVPVLECHWIEYALYSSEGPLGLF